MSAIRPILMSAPMVRALLAGTKTQTRRTIKPQPYSNGLGFVEGELVCHNDYLPPSTMLLDVERGGRLQYTTSDVQGWENSCPYGVPGDLLYVKEAWRTAKSLDDLDATKIAEKCLDAGYRVPWTPIKFESDGYMCSTWHGFGNGHEKAAPGRYRHARFMPRWASRITLRITEVRVQRLHVISEHDALAEGFIKLRATGRITDAQGGQHAGRVWLTASAWYRYLWESINGAGAWDANPFVWALTFEVLQKNVDEVIS